MAALTVTARGNPTYIGPYMMITYRTAAMGTASAAEWIATGLGWIEAVIGYAVIGDTTLATSIAVQLNARGTGVAEGTNPGDLGIETGTATQDVIEITVIGKV